MDPAATDPEAGTRSHSHVLAQLASGDVVLIRRVRNGRVYYVAPGAAIADSETAGAAARRGVTVTVDDVIHAQVFAGVDHYFFAATVGSVTDAGWPAQARDDFELADELDGTFEVVTLPATQLLGHDVRPWELAKRFWRRPERDDRRADRRLGTDDNRHQMTTHALPAMMTPSMPLLRDGET